MNFYSLIIDATAFSLPLINTGLTSLLCGILQGCWSTLLLDCHFTPYQQATILHVSLLFSDTTHTVSFNELSNIHKQKDRDVSAQNFITTFLKNGSLQLDRSFKETKMCLSK